MLLCVCIITTVIVVSASHVGMSSMRMSISHVMLSWLEFVHLDDLNFLTQSIITVSTSWQFCRCGSGDRNFDGYLVLIQ